MLRMVQCRAPNVVHLDTDLSQCFDDDGDKDVLDEPGKKKYKRNKVKIPEPVNISIDCLYAVIDEMCATIYDFRS